MQILQLPGTDKQLYELVAPLGMDPKVLRQNYNFPFRTSPRFEWFVAVDDGNVLGFVPVEHKRNEDVINNYYVVDRKTTVLEDLLQYAITHLEGGTMLAAVSFKEDKELFARLGFEEETVWTRYVRMHKTVDRHEPAKERV